MNVYSCYHQSGTWLIDFESHSDKAAAKYALAYFTKPVKTVNESTGKVVLSAEKQNDKR